MQKYNKVNYIYTVETNCKGCNKCIFVCPTKANRAYWENSRNIINIKSGFCISCGECISICDHDARDYVDDLDLFFNDLQNGQDISLVVAPAAYQNFTNLKKVLGYLKSLGLNKIYDVSYGADICTWAYLKYIERNKPKTVIAQPCPVVVSYIEKFHTELLPYLSPVQSPVICLATILKKYDNVTDKFAFLSPCVGKKRECNEESTGDVLHYNITFAKLYDYITDNNINLDDYPEAQFDNIDSSIGLAFPRPGGLSENVKYHLGNDVWTKQIEGVANIERYFGELVDDIKNDKPVPLLIDALNCEHGCNIGTGTKKTARFNDIDYKINVRKGEVLQDNTARLMNYFDENLRLEDFFRVYTDRSSDYAKPDDVNLDPIFEALGKKSFQDRNTNCFSCGYGSCEAFAYAIAHGDNHINNCHHFLLDKFVSLSTIDVLTNVFNRYSYFETLSNLENSHPNLLGVLFADINKLKETNDTLGHDAGDELIINATAILRQFFENNIYRIGGDEFVILEICRTTESFIEKVNELKRTLSLDKSVLLSVGYSFSHSHSELSDKINEAEKKMYIDKEAFYKTHYRYDRRR